MYDLFWYNARECHLTIITNILSAHQYIYHKVHSDYNDIFMYRDQITSKLLQRNNLQQQQISNNPNKCLQFNFFPFQDIQNKLNLNLNL